MRVQQIVHMSSAAPPRVVTKSLLSCTRLIDSLTPEERRRLKRADAVSIGPRKSSSEERVLRLGLGVHILDGGDGSMLKLAVMPWARHMDQWGPEEWAWLLVLLMHQASDVLPAMTRLNKARQQSSSGIQNEGNSGAHESTCRRDTSKCPHSMTPSLGLPSVNRPLPQAMPPFPPSSLRQSLLPLQAPAMELWYITSCTPQILSSSGIKL